MEHIEHSPGITAKAPSHAGYVTPRLRLLGDLQALTATGSKVGKEDSDGNSNGCNGIINSTYNKC